jgi:protein required for attachment to host cells
MGLALETRMPKPLRTQFVIADAGRARWVRRSDETRDFVTTREIKADRPVGDVEDSGVVFEGSSGRPSGVRDPQDAVRKAREGFAAEIAAELDAEARRGEFQRLAVVAPSHTLEAIRNHLAGPAADALAASLAKDLTKTPDHELKTWLEPLESDRRPM